MIVAVATIGMRDLRYRHRGDAEFRLGDRRDYSCVAKQLGSAPNLRAISKRLLENWYACTLAGELEIPILQPALDHVREKTETIDRLILIVTDQPVAGAYRDSDTIHCGELIKEMISGRPEIKNVDIFAITIAPNEVDPVYEVIRDELAALDPRPTGFLALASGGTPAMCDGLRHAAINVFAEIVTVVHVGEPAPGSGAPPLGAAPGAPRPMDPAPYLKDAVRLGARSLIQHGNYAGALDVLQTFGAHHWHGALLPLLKHARARVNLARGRVRTAADAVRGALKPVPSALNACLELPGGNFAVLGFTNEVRFLIGQALRQERYVDAVFRIALFREACEAIFSIAVIFPPCDFPEHIYPYLNDEWLATGTALDARLRGVANKMERAGHQGWNVAGAKGRVFGLAVEHGGHGCWGEAAELIQWDVFRCLARLRNMAIHALGGISKGSLENCIQPRPDGMDPFEYLQCRLNGIIEKLYACFNLYDCFDEMPTADPYRVMEREMLRLTNL